ncbi:MAG: rhomboid family intramembrane serine protease [Sphingobacteriales bacterium]
MNEILFFKGTPATFAIMTAILICSCAGFYHKVFFSKLILHPYSIVRQKEYYRLFTSDLVHVDFMHLLLNELMLYLICGSLEEHLKIGSAHGSWQFLFIYACSLFSGVVVTTLRHRKQFDYSGAGASGSLMGCMMSFMILKPNYIAFYLPVIGGVKNTWTAIIFIVILIWYQQQRKNRLFNHELHFWGAIGGIAATFILFPGVL